MRWREGTRERCSMCAPVNRDQNRGWGERLEGDGLRFHESDQTSDGRVDVPRGLLTVRKQ